jgi:hypothetical protein
MSILSRSDREVFARIGVGVVLSTLALTASFVGLLALLTGEAVAVGSRLPLYVLAMAVAFVVVIVRSELRNRDGRVVLATAGSVSVGTLVLVTLAGEGLVYAAREPDAVVASSLLFYFLAAGLIATGLGFWGARHWREFADVQRI